MECRANIHVHVIAVAIAISDANSLVFVRQVLQVGIVGCESARACFTGPLRINASRTIGRDNQWLGIEIQQCTCFAVLCPIKCQMPNAKCQMPNAKCQMPNAKCQMPNALRQSINQLAAAHTHLCNQLLAIPYVPNTILGNSCRWRNLINSDSFVESFASLAVRLLALRLFSNKCSFRPS
jgi:hypothetical protein